MNTKELIALNNEMRTKLSEKNEAYYSKILIYVRLKLQLSEHQSEEILMEILNHLIEAQAEGKTAQDVFGKDPIHYAEDLIEQLPNERKRNIFWFFTGIAVNIVGYVLIIRGVLLLLLGNFTEVNYNLPLVTISIIVLLIVLFIISVVSFIFRRARRSLINDSSTFKDSLFAGVYAAVNMGVFLLIIYTLPELGWTIHLSAWTSILIGTIIWGSIFIIKKMEKRKPLS